ncbi:MAG: hypothetical protein RQM92_12615 [Candidatus Syntrophopropionicum ammoniitolerans]
MLFAGDGVSQYRQLLADGLGKQALFAPAMSNFPRGAAVAELGLAAFKADRGMAGRACARNILGLPRQKWFGRKK